MYGSGETRESGMQHIRSLDVGLATAHRIIEEHPQSPLAKEIRALLEDCWWWRSQLSLEMLETARQCKYDGSHREAKILAMSAFGGPANSKLTAEDVFAHLQHLALRSQKGMLRMSKRLICIGISPWGPGVVVGLLFIFLCCPRIKWP